MIKAAINSKIDNLLIPCMYFNHWLLLSAGSLFFRYKYSAICLSTPIWTYFNKVSQQNGKLWQTN